MKRVLNRFDPSEHLQGLDELPIEYSSLDDASQFFDTANYLNRIKDLPDDIFKVILCMVMEPIVTDKPWDSIKMIYRLKRTSSYFNRFFLTDDEIAIYMQIPLLHVLATTGKWTRIVNLKIDHQHRPTHCVFLKDRFLLSPLLYAKGVNRLIHYHDTNNIGIGLLRASTEHILEALMDLKNRGEITYPQSLSFRFHCIMESKVRESVHSSVDFQSNLHECLCNDGNVNSTYGNGVTTILCLIHKELPTQLNILITLVELRNNELRLIHERLQTIPRFIDVLNIQDEEEGNTPLHVAVKCASYECLDVLLENKAKINVKNRNGNTPISVAAINNDIHCLKLLLKHGSEYINETDNDGHSAIFSACRYDYVESLIELIMNNANIEIRDKDGTTPLSMCALNGSSKCLKVLIAHKVDVNVIDRLGNTPLHNAIISSHYECVKELCSVPNINLDIVNDTGFTPIYSAVINNDHDSL